MSPTISSIDIVKLIIISILDIVKVDSAVSRSKKKSMLHESYFSTSATYSFPKLFCHHILRQTKSVPISFLSLRDIHPQSLLPNP